MYERNRELMFLDRGTLLRSVHLYRICYRNCNLNTPLQMDTSPISAACQGGPKFKKKEQGSIFFELTPVLGLTTYVSGRLSIYGNSISIFR